MIGDAPDEYDLVEPDEPDAEPKPAPPPRPTLPGAPGQPLPRLWKTEPDEPPPPRAASEPPKKAEPTPRPRRRSSREGDDAGPTRRTGLKPKPSDDGEKKVLIEDTPVLDTIETRQRVRLATGALFAFVIGLGCYIFYTAFIYDPFPMGPVPDADDYPVEAGPAPTSIVDLEGEARAMLARARDAAEAGRTEQGVALLGQLVKTYKNTRTAAEAKEALGRYAANLPLFPTDGPTVAAASPAPTSAPEPPPRLEPKPSPTTAADATAGANPSPTAMTAEVAPTPAVASPDEPPARRLPAGFVAAEDAGMDPSGWPSAIIGARDGARMVLVPGGVFPMGDDRDPVAAPSHKVRLSTYYIDRHEVTVGQFKRFLDQSRYRGKSNSNWSQLGEKTPAPDDRPIVEVTLADALAFAEWAGKSLPTEAQWEAAARTDDGRVHPWGDDPPNYARKRPLRQVDAVMAFPEDRSPFGAFDLAGNVLEWTADAWDRNYYRSLAGRIVDDPTGAEAKGRYDVVVKGGKGNGAGREPISLDKRLTYVGFRCALQVERPVASAASVVAPATPATPTARPATSPAGQPVVPF